MRRVYYASVLPWLDAGRRPGCGLPCWGSDMGDQALAVVLGAARCGQLGRGAEGTLGQWCHRGV